MAAPTKRSCMAGSPKPRRGGAAAGQATVGVRLRVTACQRSGGGCTAGPAMYQRGAHLGPPEQHDVGLCSRGRRRRAWEGDGGNWRRIGESDPAQTTRRTSKAAALHPDQPLSRPPSRTNRDDGSNSDTSRGSAGRPGRATRAARTGSTGSTGSTRSTLSTGSTRSTGRRVGAAAAASA